MAEFLKDHGWLLTSLSLGTCLLGFAALLVIAIRLPTDYFVESDAQRRPTPRRPVLSVLLRISKNFAGILLVGLGLISAIPLIPGPGLLFILMGVSLLDIPGRRRLERYLITRPLILKPLNGIRKKWNEPPLQIPKKPAVTSPPRVPVSSPSAEP